MCIDKDAIKTAGDATSNINILLLLLLLQNI